MRLKLSKKEVLRRQKYLQALLKRLSEAEIADSLGLAERTIRSFVVPPGNPAHRVITNRTFRTIRALAAETRGNKHA